MKLLTTRQAAKVAGISLVTLQRWIRSGKVKAPRLRIIGGGKFRLWSKADVARIRKAKAEKMKPRKYAYRPVGYARYQVKTTAELAKVLRISVSRIRALIWQGKVTAPKPVRVGKQRITYWTTKDIKRVKKELKRRGG
jgi:excisionase family DNA binding protein